MPAGRPIAEFRCERSDLFSQLSDAKWFHDFVEYQYKGVVFNMEPVSPILSEYWIAQAHYRWTKDIEHTSKKEYGGRPLDHFKRAGFLCYWLRRCPPLSDLMANPDLVFAQIRYRDKSPILTQYGNVFAAFDIGLRICRYWESARTDINYSADQRQTIAKFSLPKGSEFIEDICYTLAEKSASPHSLNMLYKGIFLAFRA